MKLGSIMAIGDMPFHYYTDKDGDQVALPCTDKIITQRVADHVARQNFMPLLGVKGRPEVRLGGWTSIGGGDLAGPWAPADISGGGGAPPEVGAPPEEEPADVDEDEDEEDEADTVETEADEDDLDALLASLGDDDEDDDSDSDDDDDEELDPELAALLADL